MNLRSEQCKKVCRILDDVLANRPTERDSLIVAVQKAFEVLETAGTEWIPCSERLPKERVKVLACLKDWQTGESKTVVSYLTDHNYWHGYGRYNKECVAWMPLPEPYGGEQE